MKKRYAILLSAAALLAAAGCTQEGSGSARGTLVNPSVVEFAAKGAAETVVGVAADGAWSLKECPDWVTVSPARGTGRADIVISVTDNVENGEVALPRSGVVVLGGDMLLSHATLTVSQAGDRYAGAAVTTLSDLASLTDGVVASVRDAQVVAVTADRRLLSDGTGFALTDAMLLLGQTAVVKGFKNTENGIPSITDADILDPAPGTALSPAATDITESLDEFTGGGAYVAIDGIAFAPVGGNVPLTVEGAKRTVSILKPSFDLGFSELSHHRIIVSGYAFFDGTGVVLIATEVVDMGVARGTDLIARWLFNESTRDVNGPTFTGAQIGSDNIYKSENVKEAGEGGRYVAAGEGEGRLTYNCIDKTEIDVNGAFTRLIGKTGEPYVTGAYCGDYWEFSATLGKTYKAGSTVHFFGIPRSSNGSLKYWTLEILDGEEWKPMLELLEKEVQIDAEGNKGVITYNCEQVGDGYLDVDANYILTADLSGTLQIRYRAMANMTASATSSKYKAVPDGGTHRFAGNSRTSPYIEITYEP